MELGARKRLKPLRHRTDTLHRGEFIENAENIVLMGGPGTGKSHVATANGVQAIEHHRRKERFYSTVELVNALEQESKRLFAGKKISFQHLAQLFVIERRGPPVVIFKAGVEDHQVQITQHATQFIRVDL